MNMLRVFCVVLVVAAGLAACGGTPSDAPAGADAADQEPQPTAVFSDDFETGEAEQWEVREGKDAATEETDGEAEAQAE